MRLRRRTAAESNAKGISQILLRAVLLTAVATAALLAVPSASHARGLSVGLRVKQDFYQPLVPVSRSIQTCFKPDANGNPTLSICTEKAAPTATPRPERVPAGAPSPKPVR